MECAGPSKLPTTNQMSRDKAFSFSALPVFFFFWIIQSPNGDRHFILARILSSNDAVISFFFLLVFCMAKALQAFSSFAICLSLYFVCRFGYNAHLPSANLNWNRRLKNSGALFSLIYYLLDDFLSKSLITRQMSSDP